MKKADIATVRRYKETRDWYQRQIRIWQDLCDHKYANHRTAIRDGVCRICQKEV